MRKILILLGFVLCGVFYTAPASAQLRCSASTPSLSVKTSTTNTKYIRTKSAKDLTEIHGGHGSTVGGLGGGEIGFKAETRFEVASQGSQACVKLKSVDVTFFAKPEIHIAKNFGRGTCEYSAVLAHEQGHIRILRKFVREYSPKVKQELRRIVRQLDTSIGPMSRSKVEVTQNRLQKQFITKLEQYQDKIMPILEARQKRFDSPEEYKRVASKCRKWDQRLGSQNQ